MTWKEMGENALFKLEIRCSVQLSYGGIDIGSEIRLDHSLDRGLLCRVGLAQAESDRLVAQGDRLLELTIIDGQRYPALYETN